jgi:molecular chaperone DnaJ
MSQPKDYYAALGLDKEASETDIKKAYRKLAMTCHPDKNPDDPNAKEKFQAISEAYSILSDAEKKGRYVSHAFLHCIIVTFGQVR